MSPPALGGRAAAPARVVARGAPPDLVAAIEAFLVHLRVERGLAPATLAAYRADLARLRERRRRRGAVGSLAGGRPSPISPGWRARPAGTGACSGPRACRRRTAAMRAFYRFAWRRSLIGVDVAAHLDLPREPRLLPETLSVEEVERLLAAVGPGGSSGEAEPGPPRVRSRRPTGRGVRDRALLELLYAAGLRVTEALGLDCDDLALGRGDACG